MNEVDPPIKSPDMLTQVDGFLGPIIDVAAAIPGVDTWVDGWIGDLADKDPDLAESLISGADKNLMDFYSDESTILRDSMRAQLTTTEKIHMMISAVFVQQYDKTLHLNDDQRSDESKEKVKHAFSVDFDVFLKEAEEKPDLKIEGNHIFSDQPIPNFRMDPNSADALEMMKLPRQSRMVFPGVSTRSVFSIFGTFRALLAKDHDLKLTLLSPGEPITEPAENELQVCYNLGHGEMLKQSDGTPDMRRIEWFSKLRESQVGTQWFGSHLLLASIYRFQDPSATPDAVAERAGLTPLNDADREFLEQIS